MDSDENVVISLSCSAIAFVGSPAGETPEFEERLGLLSGSGSEASRSTEWMCRQGRDVCL